MSNTRYDPRELLILYPEFIPLHIIKKIIKDDGKKKYKETIAIIINNHLEKKYSSS